MVRKAESSSRVSAVIDESMYSLPSLERREVPAWVRGYVRQLLPRLPLLHTSRAVLDAFAGVDVKAERIADLLRANPVYEYLLLRQVTALAPREEALSLESAIVLYGMLNTRNWVVALQFSRQVRGRFPEFDLEGKFKGKPTDLLPRASRLEASWSTDQGDGAHIAYLAGLHWDLLSLIAHVVVPDLVRCKAVLTFLDRVASNSAESAMVGAQLAPRVPKFEFRKYAYAACVMRDLGKGVMAMLDPGYIGFCERAERAGLPREVRMVAEEEQFGITHPVVSSWVVEQVGLMGELAPALLHHHEPDLLQGRHAGLYQLACLISKSATGEGRLS